MMNRFCELSLLSLPLLFGACQEQQAPMVNLGVDDSYIIYRMQPLRLHSELTAGSYIWTCTYPDGSQNVLSETRDCLFLATEEGTYGMAVEIFDENTALRHDFSVRVIHEEVEYSPYITKVHEYCPAPGQFINKMPYWETGDTGADMLQKVEDCISGTTDELVSLGAYGGYITFAFDHTVVNIPGEYDFLIRGNAFYEVGFEDYKAGSCEPGIVMVSLDVNGNGLPDDEWYELAGSEYLSPATLHDYRITYSRPVEGKPAVPQGQYILDAEYIPWTDSEGESGYVAMNYQHAQDYYPKWVAADKLTFRGSRLSNNALDVYGNGLYFQLKSYPWGYVDNHPNSTEELNSFDISWAVDSYGVPVMLPGADFIRVYTALNQYCHWIGETSTEISGARDLHLLPAEPANDSQSE